MNRYPHSGLGTKLRLLLARLDGDLTDFYRREGLSFRPRFYPVFELLIAQQRASVSQVASHLQTSQPAATQTLAEMKRLGLVTFESGRDGRERIVNLTPHAIDMALELRPIWEAVSSAASRLDDELSFPLSAVLDEALLALERESFPERIAQHRLNAGD